MRHRLGFDAGADMWTQECGGIQVHPVPQKSPEFLLNRDEPQPDPASWDELDQEINVTLWAQLPASCRAEQGKTRDTVPSAEFSKPFAVNRPEHVAHWSLAIIRGACVLDGTRPQTGLSDNREHGTLNRPP